MPQRTRPIRRDSSVSLPAISVDDVPWFCNFGKTIENAHFILSAQSYATRTTQPDLCSEKRSANTKHVCNPGVLLVNDVTGTSVTSYEERDNRTNRVLRAHKGTRMLSEVPLHMSKNARFSHDELESKVGNSMQMDRSDGFAPRSLGSILRRMASFDRSEKDRSESRFQGYTEFSNAAEASKVQESNSVDTTCSPSEEEKYRSSRNVAWFEGTVSQIKNGSAQNPKRQKNDTNYRYNQGKRKGYRCQAISPGERSTRNTASVIRRMMSFEKQS